MMRFSSRECVGVMGWVGVLCGILAWGSSLPIAFGDSVMTLDGRVRGGTVVMLDKTSLTLRVGGTVTKVPTGDLFRIFFEKAAPLDVAAKASKAAKVDKADKASKVEKTDKTKTAAGVENPWSKLGGAVIETAGGDIVPVTSVAMADDHVVCRAGALGALRLSVERLAAMYLPSAKATAGQLRRRRREKKLRAGTKDMLVIARADGQWQRASGVLKGVGEAKISFRYRKADRTIARKTVPLILLAEMVGERKAARGVVTLRSGARVHFLSVAGGGAKGFTFETCDLGVIPLLRAQIAQIAFISDRLVALTSLTPTTVREHGLFDTKFPHRVGVSVGGTPLRLDGTLYADGLGLHSVCELTYDLGGAYTTFVATAGIDDAVRPAGKVTLTVFADGKPVWGPKPITGTDRAVPLRVDLKKAKAMKIRVDFGADKLPTSDHLDLVNPLLVK